MKKNLQPKVNTDCVVTCACGNTFTTTSTKQKITVDICSQCHPFYTGKQRYVDTEGRIEKFEKKVKLAQEKQKARKAKASKKTESTKKKQTKKKTLKEMLAEAQTTGGSKAPSKAADEKDPGSASGMTETPSNSTSNSGPKDSKKSDKDDGKKQ
ncbi:50S ribosomal protein L31 [candidate division WWE3 bacterium]|nr:50S ribosomal protein L31 [candidate division WWE3 bacterium]